MLDNSTPTWPSTSSGGQYGQTSPTITIVVYGPSGRSIPREVEEILRRHESRAVEEMIREFGEQLARHRLFERAERFEREKIRRTREGVAPPVVHVARALGTRVPVRLLASCRGRRPRRGRSGRPASARRARHRYRHA